jgi:hypothetical protein
MFNQGFDNSVGYSQMNPYNFSSPYSSTKQGRTGGTTLVAIIGVIAAGILIGMALGLGLGIGAAGLVSSTNLTVVTNTTTITSSSASSFDLFHYLYVFFFIFVFNLI